MANKVFIATSMDGFIADKDGGIDWLHEDANPADGDGGFTEFMETIDALIMGRNTYEKVLSFGIDWPYTKKVFVLSTTLNEVEPELNEKVEIVSGAIKDIVSNLKDKGFKNLYIDGGRAVQSFIQENLIDELIVTRIPVVLGEGIPLFGAMEKPMKLNHVATKTFASGMVQSHYKVKK